MSDSISWRRFCRIGLDGTVPHPTTLMKLTTRCGEAAVAGLNEALLVKAAGAELLRAVRVCAVAIPRQATAFAARKAIEHGRGFRKLVKWRTGCEGRISHLKHRYGGDRTRLDSTKGAAIWCGHGVFAHNLVKIGSLAS